MLKNKYFKMSNITLVKSKWMTCRSTYNIEKISSRLIKSTQQSKVGNRHIVIKYLMRPIPAENSVNLVKDYPNSPYYSQRNTHVSTTAIAHNENPD